jgi:hypothetical protein
MRDRRLLIDAKLALVILALDVSAVDSWSRQQPIALTDRGPRGI